MSIQLSWGDSDETLLVWHLHDNWRTAEFLRTMDQAYFMIVSRKAAIAAILDMRRSGLPPPDFIPAAHRLMRGCPHNLQRIVILTPDQAWRNLWQVTMLFYPDIDWPLVFADTVDEAYERTGLAFA